MRKLNFYLLTVNLGIKIMEIIITLIGIYIFKYRDLIPFSEFLMPISIGCNLLLYYINWKFELKVLTPLIIIAIIINLIYTIYDL